MSDTLENSLSKEKLQQLITAIGSRPVEDTTKIEADEYDWRQPHCFTCEQTTKLDDFAKKMCKVIIRKFTNLCRGNFDVRVDSITQHFAKALLDQLLASEQNDHYIAFGTDPDRPCGLVAIPAQTALALVAQLLGDTEVEKDAKTELSQLEESILLDIATTIVEAFSEAHDSYTFQPAENIVRKLLPLDLEGAEELCKITLKIQKTDADETEVSILVLCETLEPVVGKTEQETGQSPAEKISKAVLARLQKTSVSVAAQLTSTVLDFKELMSLQTGDILLLNKRVGEPVELIVDDRVAFLGQPAKSAGNYAVVVTETIL
jgi:flagellar motor switch protein FliM